MADKITYVDKESLVTDPTIAEKNKVTDNNMNEIKSAVNNNADQLDETIVIGDENITNNSRGVINESEYIPYINSEIAIGSTNPNNTPTWFKQGKNLANNILATQTESGITITKNSDGTIKLNGTASANVTKTIAVVNLLGGKTYTLSGGENLSTETVRLDMRTSEVGSIYNNWYLPAISTMIITNDVTLYLTMRIQSGASFTNKIIYPMLEENSIATTYEPYIAPSIIVDNREIYNKEKIEGTILYQGAGNTSTLTLNDNIANYKYIEIEFNIGGSMPQILKAPASNNQNYNLTTYWGVPTNQLYVTMKRVNITNTTLTVEANRYLEFVITTSGITLSEYSGVIGRMIISKIIGYK